MLKEFKAFAMRGNVLDLAIGIILGASFGTVVKSMVDDVIMPPVGLLLGRVDFKNMFSVLKQGTPAGPYASLADAQGAGAVTVNYGMFINTVVAFLIVAFVVYLIVRAVNRMKPAEAAAAPTMKECPFCRLAIPKGATRCPECTSELAAA